MNNLIARIENYKMGALGGVGKEQERDPDYVSKHYKNPDHDPDKMGENVTLQHDPARDGKTWERYVQDFRQEHDIQGRFTTKGGDKSQTNVATQFMITASPEYLAGMDKGEQLSFFQDAFQFLREQYPDYHWVEVTIHRDEKTPHMHALALPLWHDREHDRTIFSTTRTQPGKEHFREFQDRIFEHMSSRWYGLERGTRGSDREHLSVEQYKAKMDLQHEKEKLQQDRQELQREKESFRGPLPEKTLLGTRYKAQDVEKVVQERNTAYAEIDRLKSQNKALEQELSFARHREGKSQDLIKQYEAERQENMDKMQDKNFLRERLRALDRADGRDLAPEHGPAFSSHGDGPGR